MIEDVLSDADDRMEKAIGPTAGCEDDPHGPRFTGLGRAFDGGLLQHADASPAVGDHLPSPKPRFCSSRPLASDIGAISKAIAKSDIGLTPNNDGQQIRLVIPSLTEERRRDLTKQVAKQARKARSPSATSSAMPFMTCASRKESIISEDDLRNARDHVQEKTNDFIKRVDEIAREKDEEIMTI